MSALLLKDFYTLIRQTRIFLIMILIFAVMPGFNLAGFAVVYAAMLPITALAYDERSKWDSLAAMMPYTPRQIVVSKYVLGYAGIGLAVALSLTAKVITAMIQHAGADTSGLLSILFLACVATIILAASLPFMFRIGVEKGRILLFILLAAVAAATMVGGDKLISYIDSIQLEMTAMTLAVVAASILVNIISISLSIRFYKLKAK